MKKLNWRQWIGTKISVITATLAFLFMSAYALICVLSLRSQLAGDATSMGELLSHTEARLLLIGVAAALGLAFILNALIGRLVTLPLKQVIVGAHHILQGDLDSQIPIRSQDELGVLARCLNDLAQELKLAREYMKQWENRLEQCVVERTQDFEAAQKQLIRSEKLASLGKLSAGVAHEINNPLTGILTFSQLLMEQFPMGSNEYRDLKVIVQETMRCRTIVRGLLDFARQTTPEKRSIRVESLIEEVLRFVSNQESFHNIRIEKDFAAHVPRIMADEDQIKQVFLSIVVNASEAMPGGGTLRVRTEYLPERPQVSIQFEDTGSGIPPDNMDKLFDPFFTTKNMGTGLGLAISYGIIKMHHGNIELKSKPGEGARVVISLPVEDVARGDGMEQQRQTARV